MKFKAAQVLAIFSTVLIAAEASPLPRKSDQIAFDPEHGFMIVPPPQPHYQHDPLHGVDLLAAARSAQPPQTPNNYGPLPPEAEDALRYAMQRVQDEVPVDAARSMPEDPMAQQIFGEDPRASDGAVFNKKCKTICDFEKTVIKPEQMTVAVPQPPKYEQYVIPPPPGSCLPPTYGCRPVPQPPVYSTCVQYKKETVPMRAQFASEPVDPEFLNSLDPGMAEAVVEDGHPPPPAIVPQTLGSPCTQLPVKTSALDD